MNDRTALVTGANKGIGKHIARLLAAEGLAVYVGARDPGRGQRAVEEIGAGAWLLVLDVTDPDGIERAAAQVDRLDVLPDDGLTGGFLSWDGTPVPWCPARRLWSATIGPSRPMPCTRSARSTWRMQSARGRTR